MSNSTVVVRAMTYADLDAVMVTEEQVYPFPWTRGIFSDCLRVGYYCRVLEKDGLIAGYAVMSFGAQEAHLLNICVRANQRGHSFGRLLLLDVLAAAKSLGADTMLLEVRPSNVAAIRLYESMGFNEIGLRKDYYPAERGREDALMFALALPAP